MDGLENIIRKIGEDADLTAASIIKGAETKAESIIAEAEFSSDRAAEDIMAEAKAKSESMISKAHSSGELALKKKLLARKVEIIDSTISKAVENFLREDVSKYFDAMIRLAQKYVLGGKQHMVFCDRDMARLPADFEKNLKAAAGKDADISIRGGGSFDGGFLLISDDMVENCTISALVGDMDTEIRDELCKILFSN